MLTREVNDPPIISFMDSIAISLPLPRGGARFAASKHRLLSARAIDDVYRLTVPQLDVGDVLAGDVGPHPTLENRRSSLGLISAMVVSPTTIIVALFGLNQVR